MARKKASGQTVNLGGSDKTESNKDWKELAHKYYRIAKDRDAKMNEYYASALYYRSEMREARAELAALKRKKKLPFGLQKEMLFPIVMVCLDFCSDVDYYPCRIREERIMKLAFVMVGPPALGKSTCIDNILKAMPRDIGAFVYSTDDYITKVAERRGSTYDEVFPFVIDEATKAMNAALDEEMARDSLIIWDQTNLGVKKRAKVLRRLKQAGYTVKCFAFVPPSPGWFDAQKEWKSRLQYRSQVEGKTIPDGVLKNMLDSYVIPTDAEGFDEVVYVNMWGRVFDYDPDE